VRQPQRHLDRTLIPFQGLGLNPIPTFDWSYITAAGMCFTRVPAPFDSKQWDKGLQPLITPWNASVQLFVGALIAFIVIVACLFTVCSLLFLLPVTAKSGMKNTWYSQYLLPNR
jgi:hypothetical protein